MTQRTTEEALKYEIGEWPAMKRVLEYGDVELLNNLSEQMMRRIKMNLKNACNIGSERAAMHNAFRYSVIESCRMVKRNVEDYRNPFCSGCGRRGTETT